MNVTDATAIAAFRMAMKARGLIPPQRIEGDGRIHVCDVAGPDGRGAGAYLLHLDGVPAGGFQNWKDGGWQDWRSQDEKSLTPHELILLRKQDERTQQEREAEDTRRQEQTAERAAQTQLEHTPGQPGPPPAREEREKRTGESSDPPLADTGDAEATAANASAASLLITYTLFPDVWPTEKSVQEDVPWSVLVARIRDAPTYIDKQHCPLISLAEYGDTIDAAHKCLRYADNVLRVWGAEGDYDGPSVALDAARALLEAAGILAVFYTSASHTPEVPRWRVLLPFSEPALPQKRAEYLARANRILGGILKGESFALSQSFYIGRVRGREYEVAETSGRPIDLAAEIEPLYAMGHNTANNERAYDATPDEELKQVLLRGGPERRNAMLKLSSRWAPRGMAADDISTVLISLMGENYINGEGEDLRIEARRLADSAVRTFADTRKAAPESREPPEDLSTPVTVVDFYAYMPSHEYIFVPTRELWPSTSVNTRCVPPTDANGRHVTKSVKRKGKGGTTEWEEVPVRATEWLDQNQPVDQMTWVPGEPMIITNRLISGGGWIARDGCHTFNLYRPPAPLKGDPAMATRWLDHVRRVFPVGTEHIVTWLAHRVQRPGEKINHALVLGGDQGIGKDTLLEPVRYAVGPWNFVEVSPTHLLGRFNGYIKSVILRVSEARDLGDIDRFSFYDHTKIYTAAPPDVLRCDEKNLREYTVTNVTGVIITTNHKADGIYLPSDDRRHYVAWSELTKESFGESYWRDLYDWYRTGGTGHVTAYLAQFDLSDFDPKAPPPKTSAFWDIVDANRAPEDAELADAIESLGTPDALTIMALISYASDSFREWLQDRRNRRQIPHRLETAGYVPVHNPTATDGLWKIDGRRQAIYARTTLNLRDRLAAAGKLAREARDSQ